MNVALFYIGTIICFICILVIQRRVEYATGNDIIHRANYYKIDWFYNIQLQVECKIARLTNCNDLPYTVLISIGICLDAHLRCIKLVKSLSTRFLIFNIAIIRFSSEWFSVLNASTTIFYLQTTKNLQALMLDQTQLTSSLINLLIIMSCPESLIPPRERLVGWLVRLYKHGFTTTTGGNLSFIDEDGVFYITPICRPGSDNVEGPMKELIKQGVGASRCYMPIRWLSLLFRLQEIQDPAAVVTFILQITQEWIMLVFQVR